MENIELEKNLKDMVFGESRIRKIGKRRIWKMLNYKKSEKQSFGKFWKKSKDKQGFGKSRIRQNLKDYTIKM